MNITFTKGGVTYSNYNEQSVSELVLCGKLTEAEAKNAIEKAKADIVHKHREQSYVLKSDPLFMEAIRKEAAGDIEGAQAARAQALQAVADIKAKYPLPAVDA